MERTFPAPSPWVRVLAGLVLVALVAMSIWFAAQARTPFPFAALDLALVHVVCAVPLAAVLSAALRRRVTAGAAALAVAAFGAAWLLLADDVRGSAAAPAPAGLLIRAAAGLAVAFSAVLSLGLALGKSARPSPGAGVGLLWLMVMLAAPATFTAARVQRDLRRLDELVEQARYGEAAALAHRVLALDGGAQFRERPLSETAAQLDAVVERLESRVRAPLPGSASAGQRLDRATELAMLGRVHEALEVSQTIEDAALAVDVGNLHGTIFETQAAWDQGLAAYQDAKARLDGQPSSPERDAALVRATTGIAYCQRKTGDYARAEAAYQELLALAPTADSHFLIAQFYEDTQQTGQADNHARRAMELDPQRYGHRGAELIRKLTVFHFGCWSVYGSR